MLEVGSLDVNGNILDIVKDFDYVGIDMRDGKGVDVVMNGHDLSDTFGQEFDLVVCFDTLEHDDKFWLTVAEMKKVLKPRCWLIIGTPSINHPIHEHPHDYYRFFDSTFRNVLFDGMTNIYVEHVFNDPLGDKLRPDQVMGYGQKG